MGYIASAIKRFFIAIGHALWKSTNTDAINQAVVENGMRVAKERIESSQRTIGNVKGAIIRVKDQLRGEAFKKKELENLLSAAANQNDEALGASYAEQLQAVEQEIATNTEQLNAFEEAYKQDVTIIGNSIRELQKWQGDYERLKARVAISRQLESLAELSKSTIEELQGVMGGEVGEAMNQLRITASNGEGQMAATLDVAKQLGSSTLMQQEARQAQGKMLFAEWKAKHGLVQKDAAVETKPEEKRVEKQKIETA